MSFYKICFTAIIIFGLENNLVIFLWPFLSKSSNSDHFLLRLQKTGNKIVKCDSTATIMMGDEIIVSLKSMGKFPLALMRTKFNLQL